MFIGDGGHECDEVKLKFSGNICFNNIIQISSNMKRGKEDTSDTRGFPFI